MSKQTLTFAAAVAAVAILVLLALQSPPPSAHAVGSTGTPDHAASPHQAVIGPVTPVLPNGVTRSSWSHGISFDQFSRLVQEHAATTPVPQAQVTPLPTTAPESPASPTSIPPQMTPEPAPISAASPMQSRLSPVVPTDVRRWEAAIDKYADENGIDPNLVAAMMLTESQGNPAARSSMGAIGLMQVVNGPPDPDANIAEGARIIASDLKRYGGDVELSLAAYNAGAGAVDHYGGVPPFLETETYVYLVLNRYYLYQNGYNGDGNPESRIHKRDVKLGSD